MVRDAADGNPVGELLTASASALAFATVMRRKLLLVGTHAGDVGAWDIEQDAWTMYHNAAHDAPVKLMSASELGGGAVVLSADGVYLHLTDLATGERLDINWVQLPNGWWAGSGVGPPRLGAPAESCVTSANGDVFVIIEGEATYLRAM